MQGRRGSEAQGGRVKAACAGLLVLAALLGAQRYTPPATGVEPVSMSASCSSDANTEVNRGTAFLVLLAGHDARRAFSRATEDDGDCALGYWGQAMSVLPAEGEPVSLQTLDAARAIVQRARATRARTPMERGLVDAMTELCAPAAPTALGVRLERYELALGRLAAAHAEAPVLHVLHARAALFRSTLPGDAAATRAIAILETAFRDRALPAGAAVALLQAIDATAAPALARRAAEALATVRLPAPQHLALRAFVTLGDWPNAVRAGEAALKHAGLASSPALLYGPRRELATEWLVEAWLQQGKRSTARALLSRLQTELERVDVPDAVLPALRLGVARTAARVTLDERDLTAPAAADTAALAWPARFATGLVAAWRAWPGGDPARLGIARARRDELARDAVERPAEPEIALAGVLLEAAMAASQDEHPQVALLVTHAGELETRLRETGRLALPLLPVRGLAAEIWQRFYRYPDAEREARAAIARYPNDWRAWLTLARACNLQDKIGETATAYRRVVEIRAGADASDAALDEARRALAGQAAPSPHPRAGGR